VINVSLPARINIVGSPTDAVEGAYATISAAVDLRGGASIGPSDGLEFLRPGGASARFARGRIAAPGGFEVEAAAVNALLTHAPELGERLERQGAVISTWTDIPASSGLAGSSVLVLAVLAALRAFYILDVRRYNDYVLAEIGQRAEELEMGVVCGFADRYVPVFGDIAYLSYHGKLWHAPLGQEPLVTYEKLGTHVPALRLVVATTGVRRDSGAVHAPMRARYLDQRRHGHGPLLDLARHLGETAWRGKIALLAGDLDGFGQCITRNQALIDAMMRHCGFPSGAGEEVHALTAAADEAHALGAKLTGAGGGGAIFALPAPGMEDRLAEALARAAARAGLTRSQVFVLSVSPTGLQVTGTA
jgi:hydroxymethylglutaryl-CoA reductase